MDDRDHLQRAYNALGGSLFDLDTAANLRPVDAALIEDIRQAVWDQMRRLTPIAYPALTDGRIADGNMDE